MTNPTEPPDPLDIPEDFRRDANNIAPWQRELRKRMGSNPGVPVMYKPPVPTRAPEAEVATAEPAKRVKAKAKPEPAKAAKAAAKPAAKAAKPAVKAKAAKPAKAERKQDPAKLDEFGFRKESLKSRAAAMYASKGGATLGEVKAKLNSTQFNVLNELKELGHKVDESKEDGDGNRKVTRYTVIRKKSK